MDETGLLLNAYYETLYELLQAHRDILTENIKNLLGEQISTQGFDGFDNDKYTAYLDACLAFVDERLETYNPFGIQYTFDRVRSRQAYELQLGLDWYDSRSEFGALLKAVKDKAEPDMTEQRMRQLADELIKELGAYPDNSIIYAYQTRPTLGKLPDYIVAQAIEQAIILKKHTRQ